MVQVIDQHGKTLEGGESLLAQRGISGQRHQEEISHELLSLKNEAEELVLKADSENRTLTADEERKFNSLVNQLKLKVAAHSPEGFRRQPQNLPLESNVSKLGRHEMLGHTTWATKDGKPVQVFGKSERLASQFKAEELPAPNAIGRILAAMATGDNRFVINDQNTISPPSAGGYTVSAPLAARFVDLARSWMVSNQAGVEVIQMTSKTLDIARLTGEPSGEYLAEAAAATPGQLTFDQVSFNSRTLRVYVDASVELVSDSVNFSAILENSLARTLAHEVDRAVLNGSGTGEEPAGILQDTDIPETPTVGIVDWDKISAAHHEVMKRNERPNAVVLSPANSNVLDVQTASTSGVWQGPSPAVAPLQVLVTSAMPDSAIIIGDFSAVALGLRQEIQLETTRNDSWENFLYRFRASTRFDTQRTRPAALQRLTGVTQA